MHVRKGDTVIVRTGEFKGKTGKVLHVFPDTNRVIVEGVNQVKKHTRPSQSNPKGGIVEVEAPIHASNVSLYNSSLGGPTKVSYKIIEEGGTTRKIRVDRKTGEEL